MWRRTFEAGALVAEARPLIQQGAALHAWMVEAFAARRRALDADMSIGRGRALQPPAGLLPVPAADGGGAGAAAGARAGRWCSNERGLLAEVLKSDPSAPELLVDGASAILRLRSDANA